MANIPQLLNDETPPEVLAIAPFEQWSYEDAFKAMQAIVPEDYPIRYNYAVLKDHFQNGTQWVGPGDAVANDKIKAQFAPDDAIGEALSNISNAFTEPQISAVPLDETQGDQFSPRAKEAVELLSWWWDRQRLQEHVQERQRTAAWAGYAGLRLWIPWRFLLIRNGEVSVRPTGDFRRALSYIHVNAPSPKHGAVVVDAGTQDMAAVFLDQEVEYRDGKVFTYERAEIVYLDPLRELDEDADTIMRIVYANNEKPSVLARIPLGGRILFGQIRTASVVTDPVIRTQRQLNLLTSLVTRLGETAAFRERYTKNAKPQGIRIPYEDGDTLADGAFIERDDEGRQWQVIPQPRTLGANTTTELIGLPQYDDRGDAKGNQMPDVVIVDPVDPQPYIAAAEAVRKRILRMCAQGHLGSGSDAEASGIAYEQARAVFEKDLNRRRVAMEGMLRELLTTVLAFAERITGRPGYFTETLRITVDQHVNAGPRSPDLVRLDMEAYEAGILSRETAMARLGVEDTDAETQRVRKSSKHILDVLDHMVTASGTYDAESLVELMRELGIPDEVVDVLEVQEEPEPMAVDTEEQEAAIGAEGFQDSLRF